MAFKNKIGLVTGGSSGIGKAVATHNEELGTALETELRRQGCSVQ